jgi:predicted ester cyclase
VNDIIAEDDKVLVRWTWQCTHQGDFNGIAPTGKEIAVTGMALYRLARGKCVERWVELDLLGLFRQVGAVPAPGSR